MSATAEVNVPASGSVPSRPSLAAAVPGTYTADQLAEMLQVSLRQIWLMRDAGSIPAPFQVNRLVRWSRASIDTWIAAGAPRPR
jgi:predicted DNA-binding transcriptional regulator AlpA